MDRSFDFIFVGGGIIGMMTARELAKRGASVAIFERKRLGLEASWAAGGILSSMRPWAEHPASAELSEQGKILYPKYVESLKDETGIDAEYVRSGLIVIDKSHVNKVKAWAVTKNINLVEGFQCSHVNINLPEDSVLLPEISQLRPPRLLKALHKSLKQLSVSIYENTEITKLVTKNKYFESVEFSGGKAIAEAVIITAGAWSKSVLGNISNDINIKPIRGQMVCVKPGKQIIDEMILEGGHYLIPRLDGHLLVGSTMEDVGFVHETTEIARHALMDWAYSIWPDLGSAQFIRHWSGLRPSTGDGKPIIGKVSKFRNIYINSGHFRKGILQAPASAKLLVDSLFGNASFMDINKFTIKNQAISVDFV